MFAHTLMAAGLVTLVSGMTAPTLPTPKLLGLPENLAGVREPKASDPMALATLALANRCQSTLLGNRDYSLAEAQLVCDAFVSFALVNERLAHGGDATAAERTQLQALLDDALASAQTKPYRGERLHSVAGHDIPESVVYRGLLTLMLAGVHKVGAETPETTELFDAMAADLNADYQQRDYLPSYREAIWPCDNAIAAAALAVHARLRHNEASETTANALVERLNALLHSKRGFVTQIDARGRAVAAIPRGSALAWATAFLAQGGFVAAKPFATELVRGFCDESVVMGQPLAACREWPRGNHRGPDATSGPIVSGYGVAASALAIAATQGSGQVTFAKKLIDTATLAGLGGITADPKHYLLENAIFAWARSVRAW